MAKMRGLSELVGVQLVSRAKCLSLSEQRPGELYMDPSLERYRALVVRKFGPFFNCWSVLWAIWLLARTAIILSSAFISDGGLAMAASRMVTCGVESGPHSIAGAKSLSTRLGRMCWLLIPPLELAVHTWTSVVGNELADAFAEKGAVLHEVPVDVVRAVSEADFLAVRIQKQLYTTAMQAHSAPIDGCYGARFAARSAQVALAVALLSLRTHDCPQATSTLAVESALCPAVAHDASGPFPRWSTSFDRPAGNGWLSQIGLQAKYLVVRGVRLLGFLGSAKLEQALYRPIHKGSARRPGSLGQKGSRRNPMSSGNLRIIKGCIYAVWDVGSA